MQVISGKLPLDLEIIKKGLTAKIKRGQKISWRNYNYDNEQNNKVKEEIEKLEGENMEEWQERWALEQQGRETFEFIKNVSFATNNKFKPCRHLVYIITGYESIKASLFKRDLSEDDSCIICGMEETVDHLIFDCQVYQRLRNDRINWNINWNKNEKSKLIDNQKDYEKFSSYIKALFNIRNTYPGMMD